MSDSRACLSPPPPLTPSDIRWSHSTNSCEAIDVAWADGAQFFEADIVFIDRLSDFLPASSPSSSSSPSESSPSSSSAPFGPVMAHEFSKLAGLREDDLRRRSFSHWLHHALRLFRRDQRTAGLKLDFKDPRAVEPCIRILLAEVPEPELSSIPIWLNADILSGPGDLPSKFSPSAFLSACSLYPRGWLSIGWTTGINVDAVHDWEYRQHLLQKQKLADTSSHADEPVSFPSSASLTSSSSSSSSSSEPLVMQGYSEKHVDEMLAICQAANLHDRDVTFPVRVCLALADPHQMHRLLAVSPRWSLTFWNGAEGCTAAERHLIVELFGSARAYIDVYPPAHPPPPAPPTATRPSSK